MGRQILFLKWTKIHKVTVAFNGCVYIKKILTKVYERNNKSHEEKTSISYSNEQEMSY